MAKPTVFLLLGIKLDDIDAAFKHLDAIDARQEGLREEHFGLYSRQEHSELVAINLQGIYTKIEAMLVDLIRELDGDLPRTDRWHKDLLRIAANPNEPRPALISHASYSLLIQLLGLRHVVRSHYASELRIDDVFVNLERARTLRPIFRADLAEFERVFGGDFSA